MRKVVLLCDAFGYNAGTDRVILPLARMLQADILAASVGPKLTYPEYKGLRVCSSPLPSQRFLGMVTPLCHSKTASKVCEGIVFTEGVLRFRAMDVNHYDLVITSGEWAKHVAARTQFRPHVHYEHTLPKALYELAGKGLPMWLKPIYDGWARYLKQLDKEATDKVDLLLCNSEHTKKKIESFYHREAHVVYPPVGTESFRAGEPGDFFLSVQRIDPQKRVHLQIEVFKRLPSERLIVVGSAVEARNKVYERKLKERAPPNVTFVGAVQDEDLVGLYSRCKAVIQTGEDEDFGLVPLEASAAGKACLAPREGGFQETIVHGKTGLLIDPPYLGNFIDGIMSFREERFDASYCVKRARLFSEGTFLARMREVLGAYL